jgi:hypothetical protein
LVCVVAQTWVWLNGFGFVGCEMMRVGSCNGLFVVVVAGLIGRL